MKRLSIKIDQNPYTVKTENCPCEYHKVRVSQLTYTPENTTDNNVTVKLDTLGKFDQTVEHSSGGEYFMILTIPKNNTIGWTNVSNCNDWEYYSKQLKVLSDFQIRIYENNTMVPSGHFTANPIDITLTFKE